MCTSWRPIFPPAAFQEALHGLRCGTLLRGFRGTPELDVAAVADVLYRLAQLVRGHAEIAEVEINPLVVYPKGQGTLALDALISVTEAVENEERT